MARRTWLAPVVAAVVALALFGAGWVTWRMTSMRVDVPQCPPGALCLRAGPLMLTPHRLYPLRAELLWAASALLALVAIGIWLWERRRPGVAQTAGAAPAG